MTAGTALERLREKPFSLLAMISILQRLGDALNEAHRHGVIHRDVKPANFLFDGYDDVFLGDFGIAFNTDVEAIEDEGVKARPRWSSESGSSLRAASSALPSWLIKPS